MSNNPRRTFNIIKWFSFLFFFSALSLHTSGQVSDLWLKYEWEGGHSPYSNIKITIENDGKTSVEIKKRQSPSYIYITTLSPEETAHLRSLIRATDFFSQPDKDNQFITDQGRSILFIKLDKKSRELKFSYKPSLSPLINCLHQLITQADVLQNLKKEGQAYNLLTAVSRRSSGPKLLQPYTAVEPLKSFIQKSNGSRNLERAIEALSWVTTPEEWAGFLSLRLENAEKEKHKQLIVILTSHPFYGNIPEAHLQAMCPIVLDYLQTNYDNYLKLSNEEQMAMYSALRIFAQCHYAPALPFLKKQFDISEGPDLRTTMPPITNMGTKGLTLLYSYLDNENENKRLNAIKLIGMAYRSHPHGKHEFKPVNNYEYSQMVNLYSETISPTLKNLAKSDPCEKVQSEAKKALEEIQAEIKVWKSHTKKP